MSTPQIRSIRKATRDLIVNRTGIVFCHNQKTLSLHLLSTALHVLDCTAALRHRCLPKERYSNVAGRYVIGRHFGSIAGSGQEGLRSMTISGSD